MAEAGGSLFSRKVDNLTVGDSFRTRGRTITEAGVVSFAGFTGDWNPHHVDAEFAAATRFGQRIVHGTGVLAIAVALMPFDSEVVQALTGLDAVRFRRPVVIGATVHVEARVADVRPRDEESGFVSLDLDVMTDQGERAVTARVELLWAR